MAKKESNSATVELPIDATTESADTATESTSESATEATTESAPGPNMRGYVRPARPFNPHYDSELRSLLSDLDAVDERLSKCEAMPDEPSELPTTENLPTRDGQRAILAAAEQVHRQDYVFQLRLQQVNLLDKLARLHAQETVALARHRVAIISGQKHQIEYAKAMLLRNAPAALSQELEALTEAKHRNQEGAFGDGCNAIEHYSEKVRRAERTLREFGDSGSTAYQKQVAEARSLLEHARPLLQKLVQIDASLAEQIEELTQRMLEA